MSGLAPSRDSALIVAVRLPPGLEALRLAYVPDALAEGIGAHVTLLYPFAAPAALDQGLIDTVTAIVRRHPAWSMTLAGRGRFPDTLYATVEPDAPIRALQAELAAAFPTLPLYGDPGLRFVPHVTIVEGPAVVDPAVVADRAWTELPLARPTHEVELIVRDAGRWSVARRFPLGALRRQPSGIRTASSRGGQVPSGDA